MSRREMKTLLGQIDDTHELVLRRKPASMGRPLHNAWRDARSESLTAYRVWEASGGMDAYAVYRAAQDREDAAQDMLAYSTALGGGATAPRSD